MPYGVGYGRYDWADFEPEDGKYDWSKIDELIENYAKIGLPVSFRITCANYHSKKPYSTPKWALDKGIKYKPYNWEKERQNPKSPFTTMTQKPSNTPSARAESSLGSACAATGSAARGTTKTG